jgi:outer membrane protein OmpA-like peptidoglycan-associated protein
MNGLRMKLACALCATFVLFGTAPAFAQVYPGEEVTVNPGAFGHGGYLLYPGGKYGRYVGHLLVPGERPGLPIRLHMPVPHVVRHVARHPTTNVASAPVVTAPPAAPPPMPDTMPEDSAGRLVSPEAAAAPPPKPRKPPKAPKPPADDSLAIPFSFGGPTTTPPPKRTASATPPPANTAPPAGVVAGLRKQTVIPFAEGASTPAADDVNAIHGLAATLNAALGAGAARVQLEAYGGPRGDKSSDSRRLSLKRALVVRELLIEDGVPSEKIDVRAMGGADDNGAPDRVDVLVRS